MALYQKKRNQLHLPNWSWLVFLFYAKEIILIDYHEKGETITSEYYAHLLDQQNEKNRETMPGLKPKKYSFTNAHKGI